ncbi:MAG: DNA polymerase III subunit delta' [Parcubacteria group bacterium Gr01-1014_13]|nr:MAG: DNA polymerase III subunit delta' [Parcubacteria group bacterium Gr01-1014_13]
MSLIGHEKIISFFDKVIANSALSQSYCFVGTESVGKKTVAKYLAAQVLKITDKQLDTHPDFYYLSRQVDEKTEKLKKDIGIAQVRQLKEKLGRRSWFGGYQVIVIDEAELLNEESGNALLKSLEEAGKQRVFFLLTTDDNELLATIRSRCQMFYFSSVDEKVIENGLVKLGYAQELAAESTKLSWGRPGRAVMAATDEGLRKNFNMEIERWQKISGAPFYKKIKAVEDLFNEKTDNLRTSEKLSDALQTWTVLWREKILEKVANPQKNEGLSLSEMAGLVDNFKKSQILLAQNINPRLVVEQILLSFN